MMRSQEESKKSEPEAIGLKVNDGEKKVPRWQKMLMIILVVPIIYFVGPRISNSKIQFEKPSGIPEELSELEGYLKRSEEQFSDLVEGTEKVINWHPDHVGKQTEFSVVYLHGFSGSHPTLAPAMNRVADGLGAHLFCTRYAGHGRKDADGFGGPMGEATLQDWVDDTVEALAIGRKLGKKVVVIANSTAAPIVSRLASQGDSPDFFIMWSPNFGVQNLMGGILLGPWGKQLLALWPGETFSYKPENIYGEDHKKFATTVYPEEALIPMMAAVKLGKDTDLRKVSCPTLCLYSTKDEVVAPKEIEIYFDKFGHPGNQLIEIMGVTHREFHVLAGDLMSPDSTDEVVGATLDFIRKESGSGR